MPLLFQRHFGIEHRAIPADTIRGWINRALEGTGATNAVGKTLRFTPHDFRRMFITDAVLHGMPPRKSPAAPLPPPIRSDTATEPDMPPNA